MASCTIFTMANLVKLTCGWGVMIRGRVASEDMRGLIEEDSDGKLLDILGRYARRGV